MDIPEAVRHQALHPFRVLPKPNNVEVFPLDGAALAINSFPAAQLAFPMELEFDVAAAVAASREIARAHDKSTIAWWIAPEHDGLVAAFEALGIVNKDTPGYEATENAMALVAPPAGERPEGVEVRTVDSLDDFRATVHVVEECFGYPPLPDDEVRARYAEYVADDFGESFLAIVDGTIVASAFAAFGSVGLNLFGGAVVPAARGRGIYRALVFARWDRAVERGTPALTVQAGKLSMPICERLGFQLVDRARMFVDELS